MPEGVTSNDKSSDETTPGEPLSPRTGDSTGVVVVPRPQRLVAEPVNIADGHPDPDVADGDPNTHEVAIDCDDDADASGGSSDVHDEVADDSDVEVVGGANDEPRFSVPAPARLPPPPPPLPTWREHIGRTTGRLYYFDSTTRKPAYAKPAELHQTSEAGTAAVSTHAPAPGQQASLSCRVRVRRGR